MSPFSVEMRFCCGPRQLGQSVGSGPAAVVTAAVTSQAKRPTGANRTSSRGEAHFIPVTLQGVSPGRGIRGGEPGESTKPLQFYESNGNWFGWEAAGLPDTVPRPPGR